MVVGCGGLQEMSIRVDRIALPRAPHPRRHFVLSFDASSAPRSPPATSQSNGVERCFISVSRLNLLLRPELQFNSMAVSGALHCCNITRRLHMPLVVLVDVLELF